MNDTSPEMETWFRELLMARSNEERFVMGASMFDSARDMMLASFPPGLTEIGTRRMIFERTYGEPAGDWLR